jgi:hypothetical protein
MASLRPNQDGAAGTAAAMKAANPAKLAPVREVLNTHAAALHDQAAQLADHGARLDALDGGPDTGGLADDGGGHDDAGYVSGDGT